tara:strand:- start:2486 stop:2863 length:378 start_codon:yes stop_codon:yes gene_type:complete
VIEVQRGELPASRRYLEKRWNWGSSKVGGFITDLEDLGIINQRQNKGQTMLRLCKYNDFQDIQTKYIPESEPNTNNITIKQRIDDGNVREDIFTTIEIHFGNYLKNKKLKMAVMSSQNIVVSNKK